MMWLIFAICKDLLMTDNLPPRSLSCVAKFYYFGMDEKFAYLLSDWRVACPENDGCDWCGGALKSVLCVCQSSVCENGEPQTLQVMFEPLELAWLYPEWVGWGENTWFENSSLVNYFPRAYQWWYRLWIGDWYLQIFLALFHFIEKVSCLQSFKIICILMGPLDPQAMIHMGSRALGMGVFIHGKF